MTKIMTKITQFSNQFDGLYSKEDNSRTGGVQASPSLERSSPGILGPSEFSSVGRGNVEPRQDWLGGRGVPDKPSRSCFLE